MLEDKSLVPAYLTLAFNTAIQTTNILQNFPEQVARLTVFVHPCPILPIQGINDRVSCRPS